MLVIENVSHRRCRCRTVWLLL